MKQWMGVDDALKAAGLTWDSPQMTDRVTDDGTSIRPRDPGPYLRPKKRQQPSKPPLKATWSDSPDSSK